MTTARMNIQVTVGTVSHNPIDWHAINWRKVHRNVSRLQARIVKATQEGRWGKVKALQHLLTRSFSGKALAVKRVTENRGKRTPGVVGRAPPDATEQCFNLLALRRLAQWIFEGDIRACFDMISHDWLFANTPMEKSVLKKWLRAGFIEE